ncbi:MAG: MotA/TolQ/ExbB proton channel family protein [Myxococcota bacterium]
MKWRSSMVEFVLDTAVDLWRQGGFVMWFLVPVTLLMWFGLGIRLYTLRRGAPIVGSRTSLDDWIRQARGGTLRDTWGLVDEAVRKAVQRKVENIDPVALKPQLEEALLPLRDTANSWASIVKGSAIVAPLAGLLGTVTGMISTFDALGSGMMYTAGGGGIGAGISEALVSTQTGLVVAVPGILIGALLARKQRAIEDEMDLLIQRLCAEGGAL